ncbi:sensor histidine kinase [Aneurinibacillus tyrosinisolvens]|uniref:sensor histidine kinase n=1 Tax=Aneurinibacillus tyrosinisolvens TaxID=1443435 RepID=UPI00063FC0FC|nr:sensor histidine kinase [Aneurinibacillus tyrosinisolvens]
MKHILQHVRLYLFAFRWLVFLITFLFYMKTFTDEYKLPLFVVAINVLYTFLLLYPFPKKGWVALITFDLCINAFLLAQTGGWHSPFLIYSYTSLFWVNTHRWGRIIFFVPLLFFLLCYFLPLLLTNYYILPESLYSQSQFLVHLITYFSIYLLIYYCFTRLQSFYRHCMIVLFFIKKLPEQENLRDISLLAERVVRRIFGVEPVYLCWFDQLDTGDDWKNDYYSMMLIENGHANAPKPAMITFTDYAGGKRKAFLFPLHRNAKNQGAFLLLSAENSPTRYSYGYLHLLGHVILNHKRQLRLKQEMAKAMDIEVRKKMAQDMHDGLAQQLFFLSAQLFRIKQEIGGAMTEQLSASIERMESQVKNCHLEVRDYISHLRDDRESYHIFDAVHKLLQRIMNGSQVKVEYITRGHVGEESLLVEETIYRIVEEAAYNVLKHARASQLEVTLDATAVQWMIKIKDNGKGLPSEVTGKKPDSFGIVGMKERAKRLGGTVDVRSKPGAGTETIAIIPRGRVGMYV